MIQIPKYLVLTGESDAMYDERVCGILKHHLPALSSAPQTQPNSNQFMQYSNKYGVMVHCAGKDIAIKNLADLNQEFLSGEQKEHRLNVGLKEEAFLISFSEDEEHLAVATQTQILVLKTSDLKQSKIAHTIEISSPITSLKWGDSEGILYWQFAGPAHHYSLSTQTSTAFPDCQCSSAQLINNHFVLTQTFITKIYDLNYKLLHTIEYPDDNYTDTECYFFNIAHVVSISKLNNLESKEFQALDVYAFVTVYYQQDPEDDDLVCGKNIFFARGDLRTLEVSFRGGYLLYAHKNERELYIKSEGESESKRGFSVVSFLEPKLGLYVMSIERCEGIYVVDLSGQFESLRLVDFAGKYEFKSGGPVIGFSLMKNMLPSEEEYKGESKDMNLVVSDFKARFLNIGIKDKDKDMLVPFPVSLLAWNSKGVQVKAYLVVTSPNIDTEDSPEEKLAQMRQAQGESAMVQPLDLFQAPTSHRKQKTSGPTLEPHVAKVSTVSQLPQKDTDKSKPNIQKGDIFGAANYLSGTPTFSSTTSPNLFGGNTNFFNTSTTKLPVVPPTASAPPTNASTAVASSTLSLPSPVNNNIFNMMKDVSLNKPESNKLTLNIPERKQQEVSVVDEKQKVVEGKKEAGTTKSVGLSPIVVPSAPQISVMPGEAEETKDTPKASMPDKINGESKTEEKMDQKDIKDSEDKKAEEDRNFVQKCNLLMVSLKEDMQGFLRYFNQSLCDSPFSSDFEDPSCIRSDINKVILDLKREETIIEVNISELQFSSRSHNNSNLNLTFDSSTNNQKIQDKIREKLDEYVEISNKVNYLNIRLSSKSKSSFLSNHKPVDRQEVIAKIVKQQTTKVNQLAKKASVIAEKEKMKKLQSQRVHSDKQRGRYVFTEELSSDDDKQKKRSVTELLKGFIPKVIKASSQPIMRLKEKEKEKVVEIKREKKAEPPKSNVRKTLTFSSAIRESDEDDSEKEEDEIFARGPEIKHQVSLKSSKIDVNKPKDTKKVESKPKTEFQLPEFNKGPSIAPPKVGGTFEALGNKEPIAQPKEFQPPKEASESPVVPEAAVNKETKPAAGLFDGLSGLSSLSFSNPPALNLSVPIGAPIPEKPKTDGPAKVEPVPDGLVTTEKQAPALTIFGLNKNPVQIPPKEVAPANKPPPVPPPVEKKPEPVEVRDVDTALIKQNNNTDIFIKPEPATAPSNNPLIFSSEPNKGIPWGNMFNSNLNNPLIKDADKQAQNSFPSEPPPIKTQPQGSGTSNITAPQNSQNTNIFNQQGLGTAPSSIPSAIPNFLQPSQQQTSSQPQTSAPFNPQPGSSGLPGPTFGKSSFGEKTAATSPAFVASGGVENIFNVKPQAQMKGFANVAATNNIFSNPTAQSSNNNQPSFMNQSPNNPPLLNGQPQFQQSNNFLGLPTNSNPSSNLNNPFQNSMPQNNWPPQQAPQEQNSQLWPPQNPKASQFNPGAPQSTSGSFDMYKPRK